MLIVGECRVQEKLNRKDNGPSNGNWERRGVYTA